MFKSPLSFLNVKAERLQKGEDPSRCPLQAELHIIFHVLAYPGRASPPAWGACWGGWAGRGRRTRAGPHSAPPDPWPPACPVQAHCGTLFTSSWRLAGWLNVSKNLCCSLCKIFPMFVYLWLFAEHCSCVCPGQCSQASTRERKLWLNSPLSTATSNLEFCSRLRSLEISTLGAVKNILSIFET